MTSDLRPIILQLIRTASVRIAEEPHGIRAYITFGEAQRITNAIMELLGAGNDPSVI